MLTKRIVKGTIAIVDKDTEKIQLGKKWKIIWIVTTGSEKREGKTTDVHVDLSKTKAKKIKVTVIGKLEKVGWIKRTITVVADKGKH